MPRKKRPYHARFTIYDPIFDVEYLVQVGGSVNDAIAEYARLIDVEPWTVEDNPARQGMFFAFEPRPQAGIWMQESAWAGIVAHECFHAVAYTLRRVQTPLTDASEETYAYYLAWFMNEILPKMPVWEGYAEKLKRDAARKRRR